jgi:beta-lactamase superfamily II metal-dependent hydrolase
MGAVMRTAFWSATAIALAGWLVAAQGTRSTLDLYFIDVEGGQATLIVSPTGASMMVDAGWAGFNGRDGDRIAAAAKQAGLARIDNLVVTHYHADHVGGVPALAAKLPIGTFVDHGPTVEEGAQPAALYRAYLDAQATGRHLLVKPGDSIAVPGIDVHVVSANGAVIGKALPGAGQANPLCRGFLPKDPDPSENARSVGMVIAYGRFRMLDLGDLTWNKEHDLMCPNNLVGPIDLYLTSHHGLDQSGSPILVHAIQPRVAVMNNGARKGGVASAWQIVHDTPGLLDLWQLHYAVAGGPDHNAPEQLIANVDEATGYGIKVSADRDGSFTVTNARNGQTKRYGPRR